MTLKVAINQVRTQRMAKLRCLEDYTGKNVEGLTEVYTMSRVSIYIVTPQRAVQLLRTGRFELLPDDS